MSVSFVGISFFLSSPSSLLFHLTSVGVLLVILFFWSGHWPSTLNVSFATLTDVDRRNRKETGENAQTDSRPGVPVSPLLSVPRSSPAREPLMPSSFPDGNQDSSLLYWTSDGLSSPIEPPFPTKHPVRRTSEKFSTSSSSNTNSMSPAENDFGRRDARKPPAGADLDNSPFPSGPVTYLHKGRFSIDSVHEYSGADGLFHSESSGGVGLEESVEMEIDSLLEVVMGHHSNRRDAMTSVPLLPLPEEDEPTASQLHVNRSLPPFLTADVPYNGDSDTPSLTPSSPRSSKGSYFSSTSPSLKSKKSFTSTTPSTDGWSPVTLAVVPKRKASFSDHHGYMKVPGRPGVYTPDSRRGVPRDGYSSVSTEDRRAHHSKLPPLATTIPPDATIRRRAQNSISSDRTITHDHSRHTESPTDHSVLSSFSDDDAPAPEINQTKRLYPGFEIAYLSTSGAVSPLFTRPRPRPRIEVPLGAGSGSFVSEPSPGSGAGISPGHSSPTNTLYNPSPKRGVFRSLFPQNGRAASEQKEERKRAKARDQIQTQYLAARSMDSFATTSSKSSKKSTEKAARRAQLAAQLRANQLRQAAGEDPKAVSRTPGAQKGSAGWEESGAMYSLDGIF